MHTQRNARTSVKCQTVHLVVPIRELNQDITALRHRDARSIGTQKPGASWVEYSINGCFFLEDMHSGLIALLMENYLQLNKESRLEN
ncbi:hypothetical protein DPMN_046996 [Dreissena polymorpha]|uniref:Uncharacterized protein n=1 Tax=Dreissena polymorpha TaxID=45954 RepID=A0A9D4D792_DREPO|nr:hypothetical protein DPMN_046996 [Dreissena polymorpha]